MNESFFNCEQCNQRVSGDALGTEYRNHCSNCLWSKHLDGENPGDRSANCGGMMKPVGLSFKSEQGKTGELVVVHKCMLCDVVHKNRLAGDDQAGAVECLYRDCCTLSADEIAEYGKRGIEILTEADEREIITQLYGKPEAEKRLEE